MWSHSFLLWESSWIMWLIRWDFHICHTLLSMHCSMWLMVWFVSWWSFVDEVVCQFQLIQHSNMLSIDMLLGSILCWFMNFTISHHLLKFRSSFIVVVLGHRLNQLCTIDHNIHFKLHLATFHFVDQLSSHLPYELKWNWHKSDRQRKMRVYERESKCVRESKWSKECGRRAAAAQVMIIRMMTKNKDEVEKEAETNLDALLPSSLLMMMAALLCHQSTVRRRQGR